MSLRFIELDADTVVAAHAVAMVRRGPNGVTVICPSGHVWVSDPDNNDDAEFRRIVGLLRRAEMPD